MPDGVTKIESFAFGSRNRLSSIAFPSSILSIGTYAFSNCVNCEIFDFTAAAAVPRLNSTYAFNDTLPDKEIIVPDSLYSSWIAASNWSSTTNNIVSCIVKKSESSLGGGGNLELVVETTSSHKKSGIYSA